MQYLLSEEEFKVYQNLVKDLEVMKNLDIKGLQKLCSDVCNHKPIFYWGNKQAEPWRCILPNKEDPGHTHMGYCDECPTQEQCPYPDKNWSK